MTKREMFTMIATVNADNTDIVEFCNHEITLLDGRKSNSKPSKTQKENEVLMGVIADVLNGSDKMTVSEVIKADSALCELSNQKVSALLRKMKADGLVTKTIEGKKAYFALA